MAVRLFWQPRCFCNLSPRKTKDSGSLRVTDLFVWCPPPHTLVLTWPLFPTEKLSALQVTAHHTQTLAHRGKAENSVCAFTSVIGRAVPFVLFKALGQRERGPGPIGYYLISLGWDPGPCRGWWRGEEIKLPAFVVSLRITGGEDEGIEGRLV